MTKHHPEAAEAIVEAVEELARNPNPLQASVVRGRKSGYERISVGDFRVIYRRQNDTLIIAAVGKRNDGEVYKTFGRRR